MVRGFFVCDYDLNHILQSGRSTKVLINSNQNVMTDSSIIIHNSGVLYHMKKKWDMKEIPIYKLFVKKGNSIESEYFYKHL